MLIRVKAKLGQLLPDNMYLRIQFRRIMGQNLNLKKPQTFNEKLQWLKIHDHNSDYIKLVDKYEVKGIVANVIGEEHIIPTYGIWDSFEQIDFSKLPKQFVLKCTHDSGGLIICNDKEQLDIEAARKKINKCLQTNYYQFGREWPYKYVKPRIIAEKYMEESGTVGLKDYKIHNFNGIPKIILVCTGRFSEMGLCENFYNVEWKMLDLKRPNHLNMENKIPIPKKINKMLEYAKLLSKDYPFVRTDFYCIDDKIYFGELTFYPASGFEKFEPEKWDNILGEWIDLSNVRENS
jgi:hypothetical protein|nr:ATP-grasp fold amidoligase family protein [uncultured Acetatifactor sp.]